MALTASGSDGVVGVREQPVDDPAALAMQMWEAADGKDLPAAQRVARALKKKVRGGSVSKAVPSGVDAPPGAASAVANGADALAEPRPIAALTGRGSTRGSKVAPMDDRWQENLGGEHIEELPDAVPVAVTEMNPHEGPSAGAADDGGDLNLLWAEPPADSLDQLGASELGQWLVHNRLGK